MKKLIVFLILLVGILVQAQTTGALIGKGIVYADSLKCWRDSTGGTATYYDSDSSKIYEIFLDYGFSSITVIDTGATFTDSLKLYKGVIRYTEGFDHNPVDTTWCTSALPVKNNAWNIDTVLVGAGSVKTYTILEDNIQLLKVLRVNHVSVGLGEGIKTDIVLEGRKRD